MKQNIKKTGCIICGLLLSIFFAGCIENDIPYPTLVGSITAFEVDGAISCNIDAAKRTVNVELADSVELSKARLIKMEVSNNALVMPEITSVINLTSPLTYMLTTYQEYTWVVTATQKIERYFKVENQIGDAIFDIGTKIILVTVTSDTDLKKMKVLDAKIGPAGARVIPAPMGVTDFSKMVDFVVVHNEKSEIWSVMMAKSDVSVLTGDVNAYAKHAILGGQYKAGSAAPTFEYKKKGATQWNKLSAANVTVNGTSFTAKLSTLEPETEYLYKAISGSLSGSEKSFITEKAAQIPNMNFDKWYKDGKHWYANESSSVSWWDSGNKGANTVNEVNPTAPTTIVAVAGEGKQAAKLEAKAVFGIMAAGNIYVGQFGKTIGTSGAEIYFGRPFTSRPVSLKGFYNYAPKPIDKVKTPYEDLLGKNDICSIYCILADWSAPFTVNTKEGEFINLENDKNIIAYGELTSNANSGGYKEFSIDLKYRNERKPTYCVIVASTSKYGDFFTGAIGSILYVDEFEFVY